MSDEMTDKQKVNVWLILVCSEIVSVIVMLITGFFSKGNCGESPVLAMVFGITWLYSFVMMFTIMFVYVNERIYNLLE